MYTIFLYAGLQDSGYGKAGVRGMNKILLIDADSVIPNLALMKLSAYHKANNDSVDIIRCNLPYYPNRKKHTYAVSLSVVLGYDKVYCSVIYKNNAAYIKGKNIHFGGTGVDLTTKLPDHIENLMPDYSIYPENNISYGFITRGCIRHCFFCSVPAKEGLTHKVSDVKSIIQHNKVKFLDNNILSYPGHYKILRELADLKIKCQFNQGLDIRLIDKENSLLLSKLNYLGEYIFAFDNWSYKDIVANKLQLLAWRNPWQFKMFVYVSPVMKLDNIINRINYLKEHKILPYAMRDISCWDDEYKDFYTDITAWCNQVHLFKTLDFETFLKKRHTNAKRIRESMALWQFV